MAAPTMTRDGEIFVIDFGDDENVTSESWGEHMHQLLDEIDAAEGPKGLVTTGSAKHYSNGLDVPHMAGLEPGEATKYVRRMVDVVRRITLLGAPTAAAVNGHAFGLGAFVLLAHDHAVMREDRGYFCFPEVHLGMPVPPFLMKFAAAHLSPRTLRQAMVSGNRYSGPDAVAAGIVDATAPLDGVVAAAIDRISPLTGTAGDNLASIKGDLFPELLTATDE